MQALYLVASGVAALTALVHSVLGERLIFRHLRHRGVVPALGAPPLQPRNVRILWATWHLASVFGLAFCGVLLGLGLDVIAPDTLVTGAIVFAYFGGALFVLVGTRGRHPGWIALLAVAALTWAAAGLA